MTNREALGDIVCILFVGLMALAIAWIDYQHPIPTYYVPPTSTDAPKLITVVDKEEG